MATSSYQTIRLALLGAGTFASSAHFDTLKPLCDNDHAEVILVWSRSETSSKTLAIKYGSITKSCFCSDDTISPIESAQETLRQHRDLIDAVVLAVPIPQLAEYSQMILKEGLHLLAEKPLAASVEQARELLQVAASVKNPVVHAVAENFRFEPVFRAASSNISLTCGQIINLSLVTQTPMPSGSRYGRGWRLELPDIGIISDAGVHMIAGLRIVAGADVKTVMAACKNAASHFKGIDTVSAVVEFENGITGSVSMTYACKHFFWQLRVVGTEGDVIVERVPGVPGYTMKTMDKEGKETTDKFAFEGIEGEFEAFLDSCSINNTHPDLAAAAAFNDIATVEAMYESSQKGERVTVSKYTTGGSNISTAGPS